MALLITIDNRPLFLPADQAKQLWLIHTGERNATPKVKAKVKRIAKWYLNLDTAPQSYRDVQPIMHRKYITDVPQVRLPYND